MFSVEMKISRQNTDTIVRRKKKSPATLPPVSISCCAVFFEALFYAHAHAHAHARLPRSSLTAAYSSRQKHSLAPALEQVI